MQLLREAPVLMAYGPGVRDPKPRGRGCAGVGPQPPGGGGLCPGPRPALPCAWLSVCWGLGEGRSARVFTGKACARSPPRGSEAAATAATWAGGQRVGPRARAAHGPLPAGPRPGAWLPPSRPTCSFRDPAPRSRPPPRRGELAQKCLFCCILLGNAGFVAVPCSVSAVRDCTLRFGLRTYGGNMSLKLKQRKKTASSSPVREQPSSQPLLQPSLGQGTASASRGRREDAAWLSTTSRRSGRRPTPAVHPITRPHPPGLTRSPSSAGSLLRGPAQGRGTPPASA